MSTYLKAHDASAHWHFQEKINKKPHTGFQYGIMKYIPRGRMY
ncbi:hypothetical protein [Sphingobacterium prati]|nr:hypothetical protein [uncultured Sphingobacterium sp.]